MLKDEQEGFIQFYEGRLVRNMKEHHGFGKSNHIKCQEHEPQFVLPGEVEPLKMVVTM